MISREDVLRMAKQVGLDVNDEFFKYRFVKGLYGIDITDKLKEFANLCAEEGARKERKLSHDHR